ncbi:MAG: hypothetical protein NC177_16255 [Ruminococcus flavefaciens]|nr:hypothetical protein [Ruminococcus flavefaciens]
MLIHKNLYDLQYPETPITFGKNVFEGSSLKNGWNTVGNKYRYTDSNGNYCYVVNDVLLDIIPNDPLDKLNKLDFTVTIYDKENTPYQIASVDFIYLERFFDVETVISDYYVTICNNCLSETKWYKENDTCTIYNSIAPDTATYKLLYRFKDNSTDVLHAEGYTHIGAEALSDWKLPMDSEGATIYINSNMEYIDKYALNKVQIKDVIVDNQLVTIENLHISENEMNNFQVNGSNFNCIIDVNSFKYMMARCISVNQDYFNKIVHEYAGRVLDELNIEQYKTKGQKVQIVYEWIHNTACYKFGFFVYPDSNGTIIYNGKKYSKDHELTHLASGHLLTDYGVCSSFSLAFQIFADEMGIDCKHLVSADGTHAWDLVNLDSGFNGTDYVNNWYHLDVNWQWFLFGQNTFDRRADESHGGYRTKDDLALLNMYFDDLSTNIVPSADYEKMVYKIIVQSNAIGMDYSVILSANDLLYCKQENQGKVTTYNIFGEVSCYNNLSITVGNDDIGYTVLHKFDDISALEEFETIEGKLPLNDQHYIRYLINNVGDGIEIYLWDSGSISFELNDVADIVSYYDVTNGDVTDENSVCTRYYGNNRICGSTPTSVVLYDKNGNAITDPITIIDENHFYLEYIDWLPDYEAAYHLYPETESGDKRFVLEIYEMGDVNLDGSVNGSDSMTLLRYLIGLYNFVQTGSENDLVLGNGNVTVNGNISSNGAFKLNANNANINGQLSASRFENNVQGCLNMNNPQSPNIITEDQILSTLTDADFSIQIL